MFHYSSGFGVLIRMIAQNVTNVLGNLEFFVCVDNLHRYSAGGFGYNAIVRGVSLLVDFDTEEFQSIADSPAYRW